jgi:hypothetical protein
MSAFLGCTPDGPVGLPEGKRIGSIPLTKAEAVVQAAVNGVPVRGGDEDEMLKLEAKLPGFGGFFIDEGQRVVVYMKRGHTPSLAMVEGLLAQQFGNRPEARIHEVLSHLSETRMITGDFSLSELVAVENTLNANFDAIPGFSAAGVSLLRNRVKLAFVDAPSVEAGMNRASSFGIPMDAVTPEVWGKIRGLNWGNAYRPVFGGLMLQLLNRSYYNCCNYWLESYGYTVADTHNNFYFISSAHGPNGFHATAGATGDTIWQSPQYLPDATVLGRVTINPAWSSVNCPMGANFCATADVSAGVFFSGQTYVRKVGTSTYEGLDGNPSRDGTLNAHTPYPVTEPVLPEWVDSTLHNVGKSGWASGTTSGQLDMTSFPGVVTYAWGATGGATRTAYFPRLTHVTHIGWGDGDSGGDVYSGSGAPYYPLGITVGGTGHYNSLFICDSGLQCGIVFNRWPDIEAQLGLGRLEPATNPAPAIAVSIAGTTRMPSGLWCSFYASATGGSGSYHFTWQYYAANGGSATGYEFLNNEYRLTAQSNSGQVYLTATATDAGGQTGSITHYIALGSGSCAG